MVSYPPGASPPTKPELPSHVEFAEKAPDDTLIVRILAEYYIDQFMREREQRQDVGVGWKIDIAPLDDALLRRLKEEFSRRTREDQCRIMLPDVRIPDKKKEYCMRVDTNSRHHVYMWLLEL